MQHEFNNRISAQRAILRTINRAKWAREELYGLSSKAIDRWVARNTIDPQSTIVSLTRSASAKLFFLANKSQEQVSPEYRFVSEEVAIIRDTISVEIDALSCPGRA